MPNDFINDLNAINRTFLFYCDRTQLEKATKISFSNHNNAAKASFEARYHAFEKLARYAKDVCGIDLRELLDVYEWTSDAVKKHKPQNIQISDIYDVIDNFITDGDADNKNLNVAVVVLIASGLLPYFTARKGAVDDIRKDFEAMFDLMDGYCAARGRQDFGYVGIFRKTFEQADTDILSRIMLIVNAADILLTLRRYNNDKSHYDAVEGLKTVVYDLDGVYCNFDGHNTNSFWTLELDIDERKNYFLTHYVKEGDGYQHVFYHAYIKEERKLRQLVVMSDRHARLSCENGSAEDEEALFWLDFDYNNTSVYADDDAEIIKKLTFERCFAKGFDINLTELYRIENDGSYVKKIENSVFITEPKYLYHKSGRLTAVTENRLIFTLPDDVKSALKTTKTSVEIPRTGELACYESINSDVCFVIFGDGKVYLAFYNLGKFYDVVELL